MRLLVDEMWPADVAVQLRNRGHDVEAVLERAELRGQPDAAIFAAAIEQDRAVFTENVADFRRLAEYQLQAGRTHAGLVLTSDRRFPRHDPRTVGRVVNALDTLLSTDADLRNREHWLS